MAEGFAASAVEVKREVKDVDGMSSSLVVHDRLWHVVEDRARQSLSGFLREGNCLRRCVATPWQTQSATGLWHRQNLSEICATSWISTFKVVFLEYLQEFGSFYVALVPEGSRDFENCSTVKLDDRFGFEVTSMEAIPD